MPRLAPAAIATLALSALTALTACSDGGGPGASAERILVLGTAMGGRPVIWEYEGATPRRFSLEVDERVAMMARASDGRVAYLAVNLTGGFRHELVELWAARGELRRVTLNTGNVDALRPMDLAYSPDDARLAWHTTRVAAGTDSLWVLDAGARAPRAVAARAAQGDVDGQRVPAPPLRWTPSGRLVFGPVGSLLALQPSVNDTLTLATGQGYIRDYDVASDGRLAIVSNIPSQTGMRLRAQRVAGGPLVQVPGSADFNPAAVRWTVDGQRLATTAIDSVQVASEWYHHHIAQLVELDASAPPIRARGVTARPPRVDPRWPPRDHRHPGLEQRRAAGRVPRAVRRRDREPDAKSDGRRPVGDHGALTTMERASTAHPHAAGSRAMQRRLSGTCSLIATSLLGLAACADGTAPGARAPQVTFYAWPFADTDLGLWRYERGAATKLTPDSLTVAGGFAVAPDGRLAVTSREPRVSPRRILVQQSVGAALTELPGSVGRFSDEVQWAPDGRRIATVGPETTWVGTGTNQGFHDEQPRLRILSLDGTAVRQTAVRLVDILGWTPDGRVVVTGGPAGAPVHYVEVYVVDPQGGVRNLSNTPGIDERLATLPR